MTHHPSKERQTTCLCASLIDIIVVDMGDESEKVFASLMEVKKRGEPYWWLSVYQCYVCQQSWLVAQEERQNDVFCLYRLDPAMAEDILNNNHWIPIFDHYEDLLRIGLEAGKSVRFLEPLNSRSLRWTISDLAKDKPGISISEIANLLNLNLDLAEEIARKVIEEDGVVSCSMVSNNNAVPNKACTRRWGFWRDSKLFSTPQPFSSRTASRRPPQRG